MDFFDEKAFADVVVNPTLNRIHTETLPILQSISKGIVQDIDAALNRALLEIHSVVAGAVMEIERTVANLDGAKLTMPASVVTINIPEITLELSVPKKEI